MKYHIETDVTIVKFRKHLDVNLYWNIDTSTRWHWQMDWRVIAKLSTDFTEKLRSSGQQIERKINEIFEHRNCNISINGFF